MVVYADILILLNILVDYFLISFTSKILKRPVRLIRIILSAVLGGISSLTILLEPLGTLGELFLKILLCAVICFVCFGYISIKKYLKATIVFFAVSCTYAGIMTAVWYIFRPSAMAINNSVVYFNISPLFLIIFSVAGYIIASLINFIFSKSASLAQTCTVKLILGEKSAEGNAVIDTGNSLSDIFGQSEVIIVDKSLFENLTEGLDTSERNSRYRVLPCTTVSGCDILDGCRCDKAIISVNGRTVKLDKPIAALSKSKINEDFSAVINPETIE